MNPPPLSEGVLAQALSEENFAGCPITLQILGKPAMQQQAPCRACQLTAPVDQQYFPGAQDFMQDRPCHCIIIHPLLAVRDILADILAGLYTFTTRKSAQHSEQQEVRGSHMAHAQSLICRVMLSASWIVAVSHV